MLTEHGIAIAPSTYYAHKKAGVVSEAILTEAYAANAVFQVYEQNCRVYGIRNLWHAMWHAGHANGRDQVARLMAVRGISGAVRGADRTIITGPGRFTIQAVKAKGASLFVKR